MRCSNCGSNAHSTRNCPSTPTGQMNRQNMRCTNCGSRKHNVRACPKTAGSTFKSDDDYVKD